MNVNPILNFLEKLVQEKLDLMASLMWSVYLFWLQFRFGL